MNLADITALISACCAVLTVILIPCLGYIFKQYRKNKKRAELIDQMPEQLKCIQDDINTIKTEQQKTKVYEEVMENRFDKLETQQLKYIINDTFTACHHDLTMVSHERLINAVECAQIYISKGLNHETGARCRLLFEELERRAGLIREGGNDNE